MEDLIRKRGAIKQKLTKFESYLEKVTSCDEGIDNKTRVQIRRRLENAIPLLAEYDDIDSRIPDSEDSDHGSEDPCFEDRYYDIVALAECLLENQIVLKQMSEAPKAHEVQSDICLPPKTQVPSAQSTKLANNKSVSQESLDGNPNAFLKLPSLSLPQFNGQPLNWLSFRDAYEAMVHHNPSLSKICKFYYLKSVLVGQAGDLIQSLTLTSDNYDVAIGMLYERYDHSRGLVFHHLKELFNIDPVSKESAGKLRNLVDTMERNLKCLDILVDSSQLLEAILVYLLQTRLDSTTLREFENQFGTDSIPELDELTKFIKRKASLLETLEQRVSLKPQKVQSTTNARSFTTVASSSRCPLCKGAHMLHVCEEYIKLEVKGRLTKIKELNVCFNCLSKGHGIKSCKSKHSCLKCKRRHHTSIHVEEEQQEAAESASIESVSPSASTQVNVTALASTVGGVLLPTVSVTVSDVNGRSHKVKVLLDSGSMSSFISQDLSQKLAILQNPANVQIEGITKSTTQITASCDISIHSLNKGYTLKANCLIIPRITSKLPARKISTENWVIPDNINLADPLFSHPEEVEILLGANYFWDVLLPGRVHLGPNMPILHNTKFGWILSGPLPFVTSRQESFFCKTATEQNINESLQRFWEIEHILETKPFSQDEQACESHFQKTVTKDSVGRFIVSIPFKEDPETLGESLEQAKGRFYNLERKLEANPSLRGMYISFMREYEDSNHMTPVGPPNPSQKAYFLPHHGVLREQNITTKLRVVFDGSARTSNGISLNELQLVGPVVQPDILSILLRFRSHIYAFSSDIQSMYRQILVDKDQRRFQKIIWRYSPDKPLQSYELNTVTYGTASAPFLATRCLKQIGEECALSQPLVSKVILNSFYVDDCLSGSDDFVQARDMCASLQKVLSSSGFPLRKWLANDPAILSGINAFTLHPDLHTFGAQSKTLGLVWSSSSDELLFSTSLSPSIQISKRSILSEVSQIFDPLGLVCPCLMKAKFLLQSLWLSKLSWDDEVPVFICEEWTTIRSSLRSLELRFPRNAFGTSPETRAKSVSLHGFSDASIKGYGACLYVRSVMDDGSIRCNLLIAKGRVAPLKQLSIPKLELLGAVTLANLVDRTMSALEMNFKEIILWTDSTIVLSWLRMQPNQLNTFVANRVAHVQELTVSASWKHVASKDNPSDLISRGVMPTDLVKCPLWFHGPCWLQLPDSNWPNSTFDIISIPEIRNTVTLATTTSEEYFLIPNYSSLPRLKRIVAWCFRFKANCFKAPHERELGPLSALELDIAIKSLIQLSQRESFAYELKLLHKQQSINSSKLLGLNPFIDNDGLLRVGGRINKSSYNFEKKHPAIISGNHPLGRLIVSSEHIRLLHTGPQQLLFCLRERYWVTSGLNLCKKVYRACVTCFRNAPSTVTPMMGDLPTYRIEQSYPFQNTGMDFAGPVWVKDRKGRGSKKSKAYVCLFICLATKAIHLELVSSLSAEAFIQCLRRFAARRGFPKHLHSDNGTNFIGGRNLLKELERFLKESNESIAKFSSDNGMVWHLSPSYSPHFGGIWEAGVKSSKHHLRRVIGTTSLTFEEFCTVLHQVEAVLNSRPLTPLSSDPSDLTPLTPGHFLVGRQLTSPPEEDVSALPTPRLKRFQHLQQMVQHFWERWSREYICQLQFRIKWRKSYGQLKRNSLVLVKQANLPPLQWHLGRVVQLHPGKDGIARVATIKVSTGLIKRSFTSICPLPIQDIDKFATN